MKYVEGIPELLDTDLTLSLCVNGPTAFVRGTRFIARICLLSGEIDWIVERTPTKGFERVHELPRWINLFGSGSELWVSESDQVVAEIISTECGGMNVLAR